MTPRPVRQGPPPGPRPCERCGKVGGVTYHAMQEADGSMRSVQTHPSCFRKIREAAEAARLIQAGGYRVEYDGGTIPARLRDWCDAHAHQVAAVSREGGYSSGRDGVCYDVLMRPGWSVDYHGDNMHTIIEPRLDDVLDILKTAAPCDCKGECAEARGRTSGEQTTSATMARRGR